LIQLGIPRSFDRRESTISEEKLPNNSSDFFARAFGSPQMDRESRVGGERKQRAVKSQVPNVTSHRGFPSGNHIIQEEKVTKRTP